MGNAKSYSVVDGEGNIGMYVSGFLHSENDKPSLLKVDGSRCWHKMGVLHREAVDGNGNDLPAVIRADGTQEWWVNGLRHRDADKPAIVNEKFGIEQWYCNGKLHRSNGKPAIVWGKTENKFWMNQWWEDGVFSITSQNQTK